MTDDLACVWRGAANTWECDEMGHLNVRFYLAKAAEGIEVFLHILGLGGECRAEDGIAFEASDQHIRYHREVRAGTALIGRAGVLSVADDHLRVYVELRRAFDGVLAASLTSDLRAVEAISRRPLLLPGALVDRASEAIMDLPEEGRPKGLALHPPRASATLAEAERMGLIEIFRSAVQPSQVDPHGTIIQYHLMGMVSDGIPNLVMGLNPARAQGPREGGMGGAALEYRFVYRRPARLGDVVVVRSGIIGVLEKVQVFGHWILDLATGEAIATSEAVAVSFDLTTRKMAPMPPDVRERMTAAIVPGLSA